MSSHKGGNPVTQPVSQPPRNRNAFARRGGLMAGLRQRQRNERRRQVAVSSFMPALRCATTTVQIRNAAFSPPGLKRSQSRYKSPPYSNEQIRNQPCPLGRKGISFSLVTPAHATRQAISFDKDSMEKVFNDDEKNLFASLIVGIKVFSKRVLLYWASSPQGTQSG